jgi:hypothetical protein
MTSIFAASTASRASLSATRRRTVLAATIGNTHEWYDFLIHGFLAITVAKLFSQRKTNSRRCYSRLEHSEPPLSGGPTPAAGLCLRRRVGRSNGDIACAYKPLENPMTLIDRIRGALITT